jgi:hypothetical protein
MYLGPASFLHLYIGRSGTTLIKKIGGAGRGADEETAARI